MIEIDITGTPQLNAKLSSLAQQVPQQVAKALYEEGLIEMGKAIMRTPRDTGALRSTGLVELPEVKGNEISVALTFGGPAAPYALAVHENLTAKHPVGQAKYLESVLMESADNMAQRLASRIILT